MALAFSEKAEVHFKDLVSRYPNTLAALLPALHLAQSEFGWISVEVMDYVARRLELHPTKVLTVATFYSMYNMQPVGKCHVQVCTTLTCALRGGYEILEHLEEVLGVRVGETSADGNYTLSEVECLASCGTAPMFQATFSDGEIEYFENLSAERVDTILADLNKRIATLPNPAEMH
ncbi:MAG: NAD(P)H-dependent oxidoreductase subunit E [Bradymonadaceae bacterium]|nr:NAD(P)H-dependent oxidoreductase subunit E [Lujinxingiaceae bacterium]